MVKNNKIDTELKCELDIEDLNVIKEYFDIELYLNNEDELISMENAKKEIRLLRKNLKFLDIVQLCLNKTQLKYLLKELRYIDTFDYKIVTTPRGIKQNRKTYDFWKEEYDEGPSSTDYFEGYCYFKLPSNNYLRWKYRS